VLLALWGHLARQPDLRSSDTVPSVPKSAARTGNSAEQGAETLSAESLLETSPSSESSAQLESLRAAADADVESLRLTTPEGNNALERYRKVLELDADNARAQRGLETIVWQYLELTTKAISQGDVAQGDIYVSSAETVLPGTASLVLARQLLDERMKESPSQSTQVQSEMGLDDGATIAKEDVRETANKDAQVVELSAVAGDESPTPVVELVGGWDGDWIGRRLHCSRGRRADVYTSEELIGKICGERLFITQSAQNGDKSLEGKNFV